MKTQWTDFHDRMVAGPATPLPLICSLCSLSLISPHSPAPPPHLLSLLPLPHLLLLENPHLSLPQFFLVELLQTLLPLSELALPGLPLSQLPLQGLAPLPLTILTLTQFPLLLLEGSLLLCQLVLTHLALPASTGRHQSTEFSPCKVPLPSPVLPLPLLLQAPGHVMLSARALGFQLAAQVDLLVSVFHTLLLEAELNLCTPTRSCNVQYVQGLLYYPTT